MSNLKERAQSRGAQPGTDVAQQGREVQKETLAGQIQRMQGAFEKAAPRGLEAAQLVRDALTCLRTIKNLEKCEPQSVLGALMTAAQLGLRPGVAVLGHCWPLPFYDSRLEWFDENGKKRTGGYRAQFIMGYQGFIDLAHRSGKIKSLRARIVYANDDFEVEYGLDERLIHRPARGDRGEPIHYYAVFETTTGGRAFWDMSRTEVEAHRDRYASAKTREGVIVGPWRDNFDGMALKTQFRMLSKWMPKSTELAAALQVDESVRVDLTPTAAITEVAEPVAGAIEGVVIGRGSIDVPDGVQVEDPPGGYDPTTEPGWQGGATS